MDNGSKMVWRVEGMDCAACVAKVTTALGRVQGVSDVEVNLIAERLTALVSQSAEVGARPQLHAATADIGVQTTRLYPNLRLTAGYSQGAIDGRDLFSYDSSGWNFGPSVSLPLFDGGRRKAGRDAAKEDALAAERGRGDRRREHEEVDFEAEAALLGEVPASQHAGDDQVVHPIGAVDPTHQGGATFVEGFGGRVGAIDGHIHQRAGLNVLVGFLDQPDFP